MTSSIESQKSNDNLGTSNAGPKGKPITLTKDEFNTWGVRLREELKEWKVKNPTSPPLQLAKKFDLTNPHRYCLHATEGAYMNPYCPYCGTFMDFERDTDEDGEEYEYICEGCDVLLIAGQDSHQLFHERAQSIKLHFPSSPVYSEIEADQFTVAPLAATE